MKDRAGLVHREGKIGSTRREWDSWLTTLASVLKLGGHRNGNNSQIWAVFRSLSKLLNLHGGRGRTRTYNPSAKSRWVNAGVRMFSTAYREAKRKHRSLFGAQVGQIFDHVS